MSDRLHEDQLRRLARRGREALDAVEPGALDAIWAGVAAELAEPEAERPRQLRGRRGRPTVGPTARWLSAVGVAAGLVAGLAVGISLRPGDAAPAEVVASVELSALDPGYAPAEARLVGDDGARVVQVALDGLPAADGFHEVWLLGATDGRLVSLGPVRPDGTYVVPDGVDLVQVPTLDVSREPDDGDPTHSGDSVLRGTFTW